ncbi:MAG: caspase family protein [Bacteroidia bacterium]|nr:caspase family protein [Bacteroidia bacterium]
MKKGTKKKAKTISGDFLNVSPGTQKKILWDYKKDSVFIDEEIQIAMKATPDLNIPVAIHIGKSLLFPGWGDYGLYDKKYNWIIGAGAYAVLGTGILFQQATANTYGSYKTTTDPTQVNTLFNKAIVQRNVVYAAYGTAALLWAWDIYRVLSQIQKINKRKIPVENNQYFKAAQNGIILAMSDKKPLSTRRSLLPPYLEIRKTSVAFSDENSNNCVDAEENASIKFNVINMGKGAAINVVAVVTSDNAIKGLEFSKEIPVGRIDTGQIKNILIPLKGNVDIETAKANFTIKLKEANGNDAPNDIEINISTLAFLKPNVTIADYKFTTDDGSKAQKGKIINLQLLLQNQGQGLAKNISMSYNLPKNVEETERLNDFIQVLKPNEKVEKNFKFLIKGSFDDTVVRVALNMKEHYGKYVKENNEFKLSLNTQLEKTKIEIVSTVKETKIEAASFTSDVDKNIPSNKTKSNRFALVIGNEDYKSKQPTLNTESNVEFAIADATIFKEYFVNVFGLEEKNIRLVNNATAGELKQNLYWLTNLAKKYGNEAEIYFYYAGHGLPDESTKESYVIPVDVNASNLSSAIKLTEIYNSLSSTNANKITVFLDACFSGGARGSALLTARTVKIKPKYDFLKGNIVVFTASSGEQSALSYKDKRHGMFTYFLLKKLQETRGNLTYKDLQNYVTKQVSFESSRTNSKDQDPQVLFGTEIKDNWEKWEIK